MNALTPADLAVPLVLIPSQFVAMDGQEPFPWAQITLEMRPAAPFQWVLTVPLTVDLPVGLSRTMPLPVVFGPQDAQDALQAVAQVLRQYASDAAALNASVASAVQTALVP